LIKKKDITIVVQGPYYPKITPKVLNNILINFKDSELILSTYKNEKIDNQFKKNFKIVYNKILPDIMQSLNPNIPIYFNYFRHIRSSLNGIRKSSKKYVLKTRSDVLFNNTNFLNYFDKFKFVDKKNVILKKKVLISSHYTIDPRKLPLPFHFSDWFFFGLKSDLIKIFNQNYMSKENKKVPDWFLNKKKPKFFFNEYSSKFRSEQILTLNFLRKYKKINIRHAYDHNFKNIILTEKILASNFVVLNPNLISISSMKHPSFANTQDLLFFNELVTFKKWQKLYKKNIFKNYKIRNIYLLDFFKSLRWMLTNPKEAIYRFHQYKIYKKF
jgi:hypothetical protein